MSHTEMAASLQCAIQMFFHFFFFFKSLGSQRRQILLHVYKQQKFSTLDDKSFISLVVVFFQSKQICINMLFKSKGNFFFFLHLCSSPSRTHETLSIYMFRYRKIVSTRKKCNDINMEQRTYFAFCFPLNLFSSLKIK